MRGVFLAWIGFTDLKSARGEIDGLGPIAGVLTQRGFDEVVLLYNNDDEAEESYCSWLESKIKIKVTCIKCRLDDPIDHAAIYQQVIPILEGIQAKHGKNLELAFHLSPGTPAMHAIWLLLGKTKYPAELLQSTPEGEVITAEIPFDIAAEYLPDLLQQSDEELMRLSQGLPPEAPEFEDITYRCKAMAKLVQRARLVARREVPVLLQGESGTGKELFARALHQSSQRKEKPFVAVNCGAIPPELVDSYLFGHKRGAFTGADRDHPGFFEAAHEGVLFLDEIGELSKLAQVRLLRVLQEGRVTRVGETHERPIDVRIIAATNRDLAQEVVAGHFREDLFHRLAVGVLGVPPLREREGDLGLLIDVLLKDINLKAAGQPGYRRKIISASARSLLLSHSWPGNIRELQNTLLRASIWSPGEKVGAEEIRQAIIQMPGAKAHTILGKPLGKGLKINDLLDEVKRHYIERALDKAGGKKTKAAGLIGLSNYQTLANWMNKMGVKT